MKKQGHYCHVCGRRRANERFSGKGHAKHICKDCDREHRATLRERKRELDSRIVFVQVLARPERKLIVKRAVKANNSSAYCIGCNPAWKSPELFFFSKGGILGRREFKRNAPTALPARCVLL